MDTNTHNIFNSPARMIHSSSWQDDGWLHDCHMKPSRGKWALRGADTCTKKEKKNCLASVSEVVDHWPIPLPSTAASIHIHNILERWQREEEKGRKGHKEGDFHCKLKGKI